MIEDAKRTPGPWGIEETRDSLWIGPMREDGRKISAIVVGLPHGPDYGDEYNYKQCANSHLIAAAPDMLTALKELLSIGILNPTGSAHLGTAIEYARIAVAKAEGKS